MSSQSEMSSEINAAKLRLAAAQTHESSALHAVKCQKAMLEMMHKNMAVAQSRLECSQRKVKDAMELLEEAERRRDASSSGSVTPTMMSESEVGDNGDASDSDDDDDEYSPRSSRRRMTAPDQAVSSSMSITQSTMGSIVSSNGMDMEFPSPKQVNAHPSMTIVPQAPLIQASAQTMSSLPSMSLDKQSDTAGQSSASQTPAPPQNKAQQSSRSFGRPFGRCLPKASSSASSSNTNNNKSIVQQQLLNLSPEAKLILREVIMSAILHPKGQVDQGMLAQAVGKGLPKNAILNAVALARSRNRSKQNSTRSKLEQQLSQRSRYHQDAIKKSQGKKSSIIQRAKSDFCKTSSVKFNSLKGKGDDVPCNPQSSCDNHRVFQKKPLPKAA